MFPLHCHIHACTPACTHIKWTHICTPTCTHAPSYVNLHTCILTHASSHTHPHTHILTHASSHMHPHMSTLTHASSHMHLHTMEVYLSHCLHIYLSQSIKHLYCMVNVLSEELRSATGEGNGTQYNLMDAYCSHTQHTSVHKHSALL